MKIFTRRVTRWILVAFGAAMGVFVAGRQGPATKQDRLEAMLTMEQLDGQVQNNTNGARVVRYMPAEAYRAERFRRLVRAFAADLYVTGNMTDTRAKALATISVTEAMRAGVPPALVLGVMRIENSGFDSRATSRVGARGLMQVMPRTWLPVFGSFFGWDLGNDTTNVRMGVRILSQNLAESGGDWRRGLLRYNGCVHGTNTPDCMRYPDKVRLAVERDAQWSCGGKAFEQCVAAPLADLGIAERRIE